MAINLLINQCPIIMKSKNRKSQSRPQSLRNLCSINWKTWRLRRRFWIPGTSHRRIWSSNIKINLMPLRQWLMSQVILIRATSKLVENRNKSCFIKSILMGMERSRRKSGLKDGVSWILKFKRISISKQLLSRRCPLWMLLILR